MTCTCPHSTIVKRTPDLLSSFETHRTGTNPDCPEHGDGVCCCETHDIQKDDRLPIRLRFTDPACLVHGGRP